MKMPPIRANKRRLTDKNSRGGSSHESQGLGWLQTSLSQVFVLERLAQQARIGPRLPLCFLALSASDPCQVELACENV